MIASVRAVLEAARPGAARAARWAWEHRTIVLAALVLLLAAVGLRSCRRAEHAEGQAAAAATRSAGEARAEAAGIPVVHEVPSAQVAEERARLEREDPVLRDELARAERELGKLRAELVARAQAAPAPVTAAPRPPQAAGEPSRPTVLLQGDQLRLGADLVVARAPSGAHVLEGTLYANRDSDGALLVRQTISSPVTVAVEATSAAASCQAAQDRAWRVGPVGGASGSGWLAGAAYARRLDLWGWRPEALVTGAAGPGRAVLLGGVLF
ncbi:hypothetical protein [Anaeromyxobacter oryzisoli]|uniref:hypothetical protein n=1 Tax=Anaeromyxobacter oryzisoli TaxID=2925408 RepID=UPI001F5AA7E1|nr:hypothetical protein [Anaeromyxobacter sp. SG63]